ncbi:response regulator receiver protein [Magnetococcus marinus MC-1]|uniref:Response regulator receiver protein n=1 Tax=Magnetococcus marinus (strain ATCC BAA-1437 / JCM 17883 / MC-1) TaxID=156889 RepID=A0LAZ5_MAGMM|nr:response regulator receiver protein [Magnetococcus marinus MC-1]
MQRNGSGRKSCGTHRKVLVVDDSEDNRVLLSHYLEEYDQEVVEAVDGHEAIDKFIENNACIDLVLMDLQMPGCDGLSATQRIREWEKAHSVPRVPIVVLSAHATESHRSSSFNAGCDEFVIKPIRRKRLKKIMAQFISDR